MLRRSCMFRYFSALQGAIVVGANDEVVGGSPPGRLAEVHDRQNNGTSAWRPEPSFLEAPESLLEMDSDAQVFPTSTKSGENELLGHLLLDDLAGLGLPDPEVEEDVEEPSPRTPTFSRSGSGQSGRSAPSPQLFLRQISAATPVSSGSTPGSPLSPGSMPVFQLHVTVAADPTVVAPKLPPWTAVVASETVPTEEPADFEMYLERNPHSPPSVRSPFGLRLCRGRSGESDQHSSPRTPGGLASPSTRRASYLLHPQIGGTCWMVSWITVMRANIQPECSQMSFRTLYEKLRALYGVSELGGSTEVLFLGVDRFIEGGNAHIRYWEGLARACTPLQTNEDADVCRCLLAQKVEPLPIQKSILALRATLPLCPAWFQANKVSPSDEPKGGGPAPVSDAELEEFGEV